MGFLSKIGKSISNIAKDSIQGIKNQATMAFKDNVVSALSNVVTKDHSTSSLYDSIVNSEGSSGSFITNDKLSGNSFTDKYTTNATISTDSDTNNFLDLTKFIRANLVDNDTHHIADPSLTQSPSNNQSLYVPQYDYGQWINERNIWQKGLSDPFSDPGYFYFKLFFRFDTQHGLFGGILNDKSPDDSHNGALKYLMYMSLDDEKWYKSLVPKDRYYALKRFTKILSYINCNAPWFFKSIKGLSKAGEPIIGDFSKDRTIEIECNQDAIDMRLTTLMDLYKFVCYDDFSNKEILPDNLRKFDLLVMVFNTPIKTLHTAIKHQNGGTRDYPYKGTNTFKTNISDTMSFKLFEFNGCEFDTSSLGSMIPDDMNNEAPFPIGKGTLTIKYDRCTQYVNNEFDEILFGSTGMYYSFDDNINKISGGNSNHDSDIARANVYDDKYSVTGSVKGDPYKNKKYIDLAEAYTKNNLAKISGYALGNIYHESLAPTEPGEYEYGNSVKTRVTQYQDSKNQLTKNRQNNLAQLTMNAILQRFLKSSKNTAATLGYLAGYDEKGPGSEYWNSKMKYLTSNHEHSQTTAPHSYADHHRGIHGTSSNSGQSAYVNAQLFNSKLSGIDVGLGMGINSYMLRDKAEKSLQDIWTRSKSGEFVGPGSEAYANKVKATKEGVHNNTVAPHVHSYSDNDILEKYISDLKENTVNGTTNLLSNPTHIYTTPPYSKS